jgi:hypothetical protein
MGWLSGHEPRLKMMIEAYSAMTGKRLGRIRLVREVVRMRGRSATS